MKRRLLAFLGTLGLLAGVLTATSPAAWADRTVGWSYTNCLPGDGSDMLAGAIITWHSGSNSRHIGFSGQDTIPPNGDIIPYDHVEAFSMAVGGSWSLIGNWTQSANGPFQAYPTAYYFDFTPSENPGQGHYFTIRLYYQGLGQCQSPIQLD